MESEVSSHRRFIGKLRGEKCTVTDSVIADAPFLTEWRNAALNAFFDSRPVTEASTEKFLVESGTWLFTVLDLKNQPCGFFSIYDIDSRNKNAQIGRVVFDPRVRGSGIAQEAYHLVLTWIFRNTWLVRIWAIVRLDNAAVGIHFHRKCGIEPEGIMRGSQKTDSGKFIDAVLAACTRDRYLNHFQYPKCCYDEPNSFASMIEGYFHA